MTSLFQLAVKDASNKLLTVNVTPDSTVGEVKDLIRQKSGTASIDLIFCGKVLDENARLRASSLIRLLTYSHQLLCFRSIYSQCPCLSVYFRITIMPLPDWQIYRLIGI